MGQQVKTVAVTSDPAAAPPPASGNGQIAAARTSERGEARLPAREYYRQMARPTAEYVPHLKYHIDPADFPDDCDVVWVATTVNGLDAGQIKRSLERGWVPARACDFPDKSGYGTVYPEPLMRAGRVKEVQADDYIEIDGEMLFVRAQEISRRAEHERNRDAEEQVRLQMMRLEMTSRLKPGKGQGHTELTHGKQYVNPDNFDRPHGEL